MNREDAVLAQSLAGHAIVRVKWFDDDENCWLWLDDGRVIDFGGWGRDECGVTISQINVVDVDVCENCGLSHPSPHVRGAAGEDILSGALSALSGIVWFLATDEAVGFLALVSLGDC